MDAKISDEMISQNQTSVCIVVPTYNEVHNITLLLESIYNGENIQEYKTDNIHMDVLVVDDSSPDGTAKSVGIYQKKNPNVHLLSRSEKNGLGAAYIAGMQHAIQLLNPDIIFEMDADLSHDPKYLMQMIREIRDGADFVIGSRYTEGGAIPSDWGIKRVMTSKIANIYTRTILGIWNVKDCTGGFRAIRASGLKRINFSIINTKGYAFQISLLQQIRKNNLVIKEIPITFKDRVDGESKMSLGDMAEVAVFVLKSRFQELFIPGRSSMPSRMESASTIAISAAAEQVKYNKNYTLTIEPEPTSVMYGRAGAAGNDVQTQYSSNETTLVGQPAVMTNSYKDDLTNAPPLIISQEED